ncbi:(d)CMP kinase [Buchnera aphidicola (Thelaxes californica)]|uniref:Cytidylate kinase n=1 Tax=Buchnera aphidicola (Thelaxes californica) TaxID=1315998 RepID=A0A4D6YJQ4_9GAMM|nr:(d)CMP kinase [Buchnera aphidicola]QCI26771.1 (d)CMP kinase [Buchnera aphidicola (Thelaxes californica)]
MKTLIPVITIDGPCGVGKSVLSKEIAKIFNWYSLDSGILYRIIALITFQFNIPILEEKILSVFSHELFLWCTQHPYNFQKLYEQNVPKIVCEKTISNISSKISVFPKIRKKLLQQQRSFKKQPGLIANGRDMGTIVFPDAHLKIFLEGSLSVRVQRRFNDLHKKGTNVDINDLHKDMYNRDLRDIQRTISPLIPAKDAIIIDSTNMNFENVLKITLKYIKNNVF